MNTLKKTLSIILSAVLLCSLVVSMPTTVMGAETVNEEIVKDSATADEVEVLQSSVTLYIGETSLVDIESLTDPEVTNLDEKVATVDENGTITAKSKGTTTITFTSNNKVVEVEVNVKTPSVKVSKTLKVLVGKTSKITVKKDPASAKVKWTTSNSKVATVDSKGNVKGKKAGTATITATVDYKGYKYVSKCKVTVKLVIKLSKSKLTLYNSSSYKLAVDGGTGKITWKSSNKKIAKVNSKGKVVGYKSGTCYISAKRNGKTVKCKVKVPKTYKNRDLVIDYGAVVGIKSFYSEKIEDNYIYAYNLKGYSDKQSAGFLTKYIKLSNDKGWRGYGKSEDEDSVTFNLRNSKINYELGISIQLDKNDNIVIVITIEKY